MTSRRCDVIQVRYDVTQVTEARTRCSGPACELLGQAAAAVPLSRHWTDYWCSAPVNSTYNTIRYTIQERFAWKKTDRQAASL